MRSRTTVVWRIAASAACGMVMAATAVLGTSSAGAAGTAPQVPLGAQAPYGIVGAPGQLATGATAAQWQAWAAAQVKAVETTTWSAEVASTGGQLLSVTYLPVTDAPGVPAGITTVAVSLLIQNKPSTGIGVTLTAGGGGVKAAIGIKPAYSTGSNCVGITDGAACVAAFTSGGGLDIEANYTYEAPGSLSGHVEMSDNGCPGSLVRNGGNATFTNGVEQNLVYGPIFFTAEWASTFWRNNGGTNYSNFGSACDYF
jgi:hypothetical protein